PRGGHPCGWRQPLAGAALQAAVPTGGYHSYGLAASTAPTAYCPCGQLLPLANIAGLPFGLALAIANRPLTGGLSRGLAMGGRPCMGLAVAGRPSSSVPSLRKRMKNT
ncbi:hypothetical protein BHM03_00059006, partial [Ensete ventricosum]